VTYPPIEHFLAPGGLSSPRPPVVAGPPTQSPRQPGPGQPVTASPRPPMHPGSPMTALRPQTASPRPPQMGLLGPRPSFTAGFPRPSGVPSPRPPTHTPGSPASGSPRPGPAQPPGPPGPLPPFFFHRPPLHASTPIQTPVASSASVPPFMERPTFGIYFSFTCGCVAVLVVTPSLKCCCPTRDRLKWSFEVKPSVVLSRQVVCL
jgi:hypothetical protein